MKNIFISNTSPINEGVNGLFDLIAKYPNHKTPFFAEQLKT